MLKAACRRITACASSAWDSGGMWGGLESVIRISSVRPVSLPAFRGASSRGPRANPALLVRDIFEGWSAFANSPAHVGGHRADGLDFSARPLDLNRFHLI